MLVATCVIQLQLPGVRSLKEKRRVLKSVLKRLHNQFNVASAEIDHHDVWQTATIALVTVGTDGHYLTGLLEKTVQWIEQARPDLPIEAVSITFR